MNKTIIALVLISLIYGSYSFDCVIANDQSVTASNDGWWDSPAKTNCVAEGAACATGYAKLAAGTTATATGASCLFCVKGTADAPQFFLEPSHTTCGLAGANCVATFGSAAGTATTGAGVDCDVCLTATPHFSSTSKSTCVAVAGACTLNSASNSAGTPTTAGVTGTGADCSYCATGYFKQSTLPLATCGTTCTTGYMFGSSENNTCVEKGGACTTNYASDAAGTTLTAGTVTAALHCQYCKAGYNFKSTAKTTCVVAGGACSTGFSYVEGGAQTAGANSTHEADCFFCAADFFYTSPSITTCVAKNTACIAGWASDEAGAVLTTGDATTGKNCKYCKAGTYFTDTTNKTCGVACTANFWTATGETTAIKAPCTLTADPKAATTSGNMMVISFILLALMSLLI